MRSLALALLVATIVASPVAAKCRSSAIEVSGGALAEVLSIREPDVVSQFHIWQGPGVRINDKPVHEDPERQQGAFIDWPRGEATGRPKDLERYQVAFLCPEAGDSPHARYVVYYEFDPAHDGGFMSLPGRPDPLFASNTFSIYHGVEGKWFQSSAAWERLMRPRIEAARREQQGS